MNQIQTTMMMSKMNLNLLLLAVCFVAAVRCHDEENGKEHMSENAQADVKRLKEKLCDPDKPIPDAEVEAYNKCSNDFETRKGITDEEREGIKEMLACFDEKMGGTHRVDNEDRLEYCGKMKDMGDCTAPYVEHLIQAGIDAHGMCDRFIGYMGCQLKALNLPWESEKDCEDLKEEPEATTEKTD